MHVALLCTGQSENHSLEDTLSIRAPDLGRALAAKGHEGHLFESVRARSSSYRKSDGLHYHSVSMNGRNGHGPEAIEQSMLYYIQCTQGVAGLFDVVHCFDVSLLPTAGEIASSRAMGTFLSVASEHDASAWNLLSTSHRGWTLEEAVDRVLVPNHFLKERLMARFGLNDAKVAVQGRGIELARHSKWIDQGKVKLRHKIGPLDPVVLFVGELCAGHGADRLIEATFTLSRQFGALKVIFAGDGPTQPYLRERAKVLGIEGATRFLGYLPDDQIADLYNACDLVVVPVDEWYAVESLLEAWCAGKPTVVPRDVLPPFAEPGSDVIAVENDSSAFGEAVAQLLADQAYAKALGARAWRKVSEKFSWGAIADRILHLYSNVGSRRSLS